MSNGGGSAGDAGSMSAEATMEQDYTQPSVNQGPAGGASALGNYGGDSSGGKTANEMSGAGDPRETAISQQYQTPTYTTQELEKGISDTGQVIDKEIYGVKDNLTFAEHYKNAPEIIKWSPTLKFLYASGKNIAEWGNNFDWTYNPQSGTFTDSRGDNVGERALMNAAAPQAPGLISNQATTPSVASQWYQNLGTTTASPFSFSTAYADAKAKQQNILGNPSAVRQIAVNESPFYNWLKDNSLNKGIL